MSTKRIAAGFRYIYYFVNDADGYFIGNTTTAPSNGDTTGAGVARLDGARTLPISIPTPDIVVASGDDEPEVSFEFDSENLANGLLEVSVRDSYFEALSQGTSVDDWGTTEIGVLDPKDRASQSLGLLLWRRSKSWDSASQGVKKWSGMLIPEVTVKALGNQWQQRTFNGYGYQLNCSRSGRLGWTTVNDTEHGTTAGSMFPIASDYPMLMWRHSGDGATTVFTLPYALVSGGSYRVYINDVYTATATISGVTLTCGGGAPAAAARIVSVWEVDESVLS